MSGEISTQQPIHQQSSQQEGQFPAGLDLGSTMAPTSGSSSGMKKSPPKTVNPKDKHFRGDSKSYRDKPSASGKPNSSMGGSSLFDRSTPPPSSPLGVGGLDESEAKVDGRIRNELLDEIVQDMGIANAMEFDFEETWESHNLPPPSNGTDSSGVTNAPFSTGVVGRGAQVPGKPLNAGGVATGPGGEGGYNSSASLSAMAKLTHSISTSASEGQSLSGYLETMRAGGDRPGEGGFATSGEHQALGAMSGSESSSSIHDGQGKPDRPVSPGSAGSRSMAPDFVAVKKQPVEQQDCAMSTQGSDSSLSNGNNVPRTLEQASHFASQDQGYRFSSQPQSRMQWPSQGPGLLQQQSLQIQLAQSAAPYQGGEDDYPMEDMDMTPDSTINYSEMPQQPNYYQLPQSAASGVLDGSLTQFNMSISSAAQESSSQPPPSYPSQQGGMTPQPAASGSYKSHTGQMPHHMMGSASTMPASCQPGMFTQNQPLQQTTYEALEGGVSPGGFSMQDGGAGVQSHHQLQPALTPQMASSSQQKPPTLQQQTSQQPGDAPTKKRWSDLQRNFMKQLVKDNSSAFRSHRLFPLLRDLIIADMNFDDPGFPYVLIRDLPADHNKLLNNYLMRNPQPRSSYASDSSVETVVMDSLKYAHEALIQKIRRKNSMESAAGTQNQHQRQAIGNVGVFCDKLESTMRQEVSDQQYPNQMVGQQGPQRFRIDEMSGARGTGQGGPSGAPFYGQQLSVDVPSTLAGQGAHPPQQQGMPSAGTATLPPRPVGTVPAMVQQPQPPQYGGGHHVPMGPRGMASNDPFSMPAHPQAGGHGMGALSRPPPNYTVSAANPPMTRQQMALYGDNQMYGGGGQECSYNPQQLGGQPQHMMQQHQAHNPHGSTSHHGSASHMMQPAGGPQQGSQGQHYGFGRPHTMGMHPNMQEQYMTMDGGMVNMSHGHGMQYGGMMGGDGMDQGRGGGMMGSAAMAVPAPAGPAPTGKGGKQPTEGRKHASLPKEAVNVMLQWLRDHQDKPYPNDEEKAMLIRETGLSITQVNYWFTNARRRLLPKWRGEDP